MAKGIAVGKRAKISSAEQQILVAVVVAALFLGAGLSLSLRFIKQISYNTKVLGAEDSAINNYSEVIKNTGICTAPNGRTYSKEELERCNPDDIEVAEIPGTLRAELLDNVAASSALNSVQKEDDTSCINPLTAKAYTFKELNKIYSDAVGSAALKSASQLIQNCSALRIIPDALPSFRNEEAMLASLNKVFYLSNWTPNSLSPGNVESTSEVAGLNALGIDLEIEADAAVTKLFLANAERSIREFHIKNANIEWSEGGELNFSAQATAYYIDKTILNEVNTTVSIDGEAIDESLDSSDLEEEDESE